MKESAYSIKKVSVDAIVAFVCAGLSILCLAGALLISYVYNGKGPAAVGLMGVGSFLMAILGIVFTVSAWKSQDGGILMKRIAGIVSLIPLGIGLILYFIGWL